MGQEQVQETGPKWPRFGVTARERSVCMSTCHLPKPHTTPGFQILFVRLPGKEGSVVSGLSGAGSQLNQPLTSVCVGL